MTTDPGDLVFDPTCGSGSTAYCAEGLGRRWITCDTSRVAINVARKRLLSATFPQYKTRNGHVSSGFIYKAVQRVTLKSLANDLEAEKVSLVDQPEIDNAAVRVCGAFEVMSLGRYSVEDWKGYVSTPGGEAGEPAKLQNYIEVVCRLYRKDAAVQGASGLVHAVAESKKDKIAISVGPLSGRVTAKQVNDAVQDALASGILEVHILGWAFDAEVTGGYSRPDETGTFVVTNQWDLDFEPDLNPLGYNLPNGVRIPLPPRGAGRLWPKNRATKAKFARSKDEYQNVYYTVLLMPPNYDGRAVQKFLIGQAAESGLSKVGALMFRGVVGPALAGVATIFVPGETSHVVIWNDKCTEGNVYGASVGF